MAIGAFFAGVIFADTDFGNRLVSETIAFRHIFVSLFFVSIGLLFDPWFAASNFIFISAVVGLILIVNCVVTALVVISFGYSLRIALAAGIILAQIGEFSFLLLEVARRGEGIDQFFLSNASLQRLYHHVPDTGFIHAAAGAAAAFRPHTSVWQTAEPLPGGPGNILYGHSGACYFMRLRTAGDGSGTCV